MTRGSEISSSHATASPGFSDHDHSKCIEEALLTAEEVCVRDGLRLTPVRRKVLEILLQNHKAMGAYAILDELRAAGFSSQPPVAYRALEFLSAHGFVHRIEVLNAFIACSNPGASHSPAFIICRACDNVAEAESEPLNPNFGSETGAAGFKVERTIMEIEGVCPSCTEKAPK